MFFFWRSIILKIKSLSFKKKRDKCFQIAIFYQHQHHSNNKINLFVFNNNFKLDKDDLKKIYYTIFLRNSVKPLI
jgi:hypothetical protein